MRVSDETNIELLRKKADVLETENERLSAKVSHLLRENLALKGMAPTQVELNLPSLLERVTEPRPSGLTKPGSERRANVEREKKPPAPRCLTGGHTAGGWRRPALRPAVAST